MKGLKIKSGMGGSRCGKSRTLKTEILKKVSKKARRQEAKLSSSNNFQI